MLRATDENGTPLPVFEKVLDINIKEAAERVLGRSLEQNLLSIVFDYDGNLWFVTGGFRIYPSRGQQGAMGYISHNAIETILAGGTADLDHEVHVYAPAPGEGAENGIASCREGAVILTNLACYLLRANGGVEVVWRTPYDSVGAKDSREGAATTGGGLAWGGGCSPSLSRELVFFTDNLETVSLMAVDIHTGEVAASHPVIDELPANMPVSVENSAIVYDHGHLVGPQAIGPAQHKVAYGAGHMLRLGAEAAVSPVYRAICYRSDSFLRLSDKRCSVVWLEC